MNSETIILVLVVIIGFVGVLAWRSIFQKQSAWRGKVIDKIFSKGHEDGGSGVEDQYKLVCQTTDGKKVTIGVLQDEYGDFEIGDNVVKVKGEYSLKKA